VYCIGLGRFRLYIFFDFQINRVLIHSKLTVIFSYLMNRFIDGLPLQQDLKMFLTRPEPSLGVPQKITLFNGFWHSELIYERNIKPSSAQATGTTLTTHVVQGT